MVVSRKRKENTTISASPEQPKRTKVIAQRKFAQGQSAASSAFLNYASVSTAPAPIKETKDPPTTPPVELIPNARPHTEDFLTFLCFRGTSGLPPNLDFFNNRPSTSSEPNKSKAKKADDSQSTDFPNDTSNTGDGTDLDETNEDDKKSEQKPNFIPFAVRKRAEQFPDTKLDKKRRQAQAVEALRKKYHDQRMAKLRATAFNRQSRTGGIRTRSSPFIPSSSNKIADLNDTTENQSSVETEKEAAESVKKDSDVADEKSAAKSKREKKNAKAVPTKSDNATTKPGTRSSGLKPSFEELESPTPKVVKTIKDKKDAKKSSSVVNTAVTTESTDKPVAADKEKEKPEPAKQVEDKKRTTRLSALRNPRPSPEIEKKIEESKPGKSVDKTPEIDFSSDDDVPLVKTVEKKIATKTEKKSAKASPAVKLNKNELSGIQTPSDSSLKINTSSKKNAQNAKKEKAKSIAAEKKTKAAEVAENSEKGQKNSKRKIASSTPVDGGRDLSQTTDFSENEARTARPTRKTKEAATIYMELIGRRLNLNELSDNDASSLDSLELPNFRKMEQIENECKRANVKKQARASAPVAQSLSRRSSLKTKAKQKNAKAVRKKSEEKSVEAEPIEKSFSASDEEPLAIKLNAKKNKANLAKNKRLVAREKKKKEEEVDERSKIVITDENIAPVFRMQEKEPIEEPPKIKSEVPEEDVLYRVQADDMDSTNVIKSAGDSPMKNMNFSFDSTVTKNRDTPLNRTTEIVPEPDDLDILKKLPPPKAIPGATKSLLGNLLPSKEESEKIFGIASVTLAQCSGPDDTKCTLGKCGAVHKPSLHPPVLTESVLGGNLSPKDRRKSKVNMTHEQIQKWVDETSWSPVPDEAKLDELWPRSIALAKECVSDQERLSNKSAKLNQPKNKVGGNRSGSTATATRTSRTKSQKRDRDDSSSSRSRSLYEKKSSKPEVTQVPAKSPVLKTLAASNKSPTALLEADVQKKGPKLTAAKGKVAVDRKPIYNQRRQPVYKQQITPPKSSYRQSKVANAFGAFSPDNEHSIYSFDKEDDELPVAAPYRRHSRHNSRSDDVAVKDSKDVKDVLVEAKDSQTFQKPQMQSTPIKQQPIVQTQVSLTLSPEDNAKTVQVPIDGDTSAIGDSVENTTGDATKSQALGVAVKLGTEGPDGPNQRVIMHAKLVTKAQMGDNKQPLPEALLNVHEIVKSLITPMQSGSSTSLTKATTSGIAGGATVPAATTVASIATTTATSKEGVSKYVPIGTVQPRFKSSEEESKAALNVTPESQTIPSLDLASIAHLASNSAALTAAKSKLVKGKPVKNDPPILPSNNTVFPRRDDPAQMVEAPIFRPTEKEFQDPIEYIERIAPIASRFGICKIIPPASFKPECRVSDDMRFTAQNQYIHKMLHRWGPSAREFSAIRKYLATQSIHFQLPPLIGGMEVDLPRLYHTVQELGGLKEVIEKKKWPRVAEDMCIPKAAHDRVTKLDDIYCKYLLPYDTLSPAERQKLFDEVEADWAKKEAKARRTADKYISMENGCNGEDSEDEDNDDESEEEDDTGSMECIVKGRSMPLNQFFRIARNTMSLWFKNAEPTAAEIENEFWRHVAVRDSHVCVHSGSIDSSGWGYGFPTPGPKTKGSACSKHPWNLKVLTNSSGSILRSLGPVIGITVPTLHVGMLFSACCWYRDPHGLPWIEYLHTGASKVWYGVPDDQNSNFRKALTALVPTHCQNKTIWLPSDTAMVPPHMLTDRNVSLCRTEQEPGQYVVVFPHAYTSSLCSGYTVSESVYFATNSWFDTAKEDFYDIQESCEPTMFSLEQLLFALATDQRTGLDTFTQILPLMNDVLVKEKALRSTLTETGIATEKITEPKRKTKTHEEHECYICRANLFLSLVKISSEEDEDDDDPIVYCLQHAIKYIKENVEQKQRCKLHFIHNIEDIENLIKKIEDRISSQNQKRKNSISSMPSTSGAQGPGGNNNARKNLQGTANKLSRYSGMATMLK